MAVQMINVFIQIIQSAISMLFTLELAPGVSLGWIFIVVILMLILIKFFLKGDNNG